MKEVEHVVSLLIDAKKAVQEGDVVKLRDLSNQTVHTSSIYQDEDNVLVAVFIYALSKIIEKGEKYYKQDYQKYVGLYVKVIEKSVRHLNNGDEKGFRKDISFVLKSKEAKGDLKKYLQDILRKARINKASHVYEHGISMKKTARLLDISLWELAEYAGQKGVSDSNYNFTKSVKDRIKIAVELFK